MCLLEQKKTKKKKKYRQRGRPHIQRDTFTIYNVGATKDGTVEFSGKAFEGCISGTCSGGCHLCFYCSVQRV
jgi:hypothetical protein